MANKQNLNQNYSKEIKTLHVDKRDNLYILQFKYTYNEHRSPQFHKTNTKEVIVDNTIHYPTVTKRLVIQTKNK